jgi:hypothetical protein
MMGEVIKEKKRRAEWYTGLLISARDTRLQCGPSTCLRDYNLERSLCRNGRIGGLDSQHYNAWTPSSTIFQHASQSIVSNHRTAPRSPGIARLPQIYSENISCDADAYASIQDLEGNDGHGNGMIPLLRVYRTLRQDSLPTERFLRLQAFPFLQPNACLALRECSANVFPILHLASP